MFRGLDSAIPPRDISITAAKGYGIRLWAGYFKFGNDGIYNGWTLQDFQRVQNAGLLTLAYCSGWADPNQCRSQSLTWDVPICLDVEGGIRGDGQWVQGWLDAAQCGLYGGLGCHQNRRAAFHVLADYPGYDPGATWLSGTRPPGTCAWQWQGTHAAFGASVDSSWWDDAFLGLHGGGGGILSADMTPEQEALLQETRNKVNELWDLLRIGVHDPANPDWIRTELETIKTQIAAIQTSASVAAHDHPVTLVGTTEPFPK